MARVKINFPRGGEQKCIAMRDLATCFNFAKLSRRLDLHLMILFSAHNDFSKSLNWISPLGQVLLVQHGTGGEPEVRIFYLQIQNISFGDGVQIISYF